MPMPVVVGVGAFSSNIGAMTCAFPAGYSAVTGDVALTFRETESTDTVTTPAGWAVVTSQAVTSGTTTKLSAIWKRLVAGDTAPSLPDVGNHQVGLMIVISGCRTTGNPWNGTPVIGQELVADTSVDIAGMTTTANDCLMLYAFATGQSINSGIGASGWTNASLGSPAVTEQMDRWAVAGTGGGLAMASGGKAVAGATGTMTCTLGLAANFKALMCIGMEGASATTSRVPPTRRQLRGYILR